MNKEAEKLLLDILNKDISALTTGDKVFLKARKSYLTEEQLEKYQSVFTEIKIKVTEDKTSFKELRKQAKSLGIKIPFGVKRDILENLIKNNQTL